MSKQRRPTRAPEQQPVEGARTERAPEPALEEQQAVGMSEAGLEASDWSIGKGGPALEASPVTDVAGRVALALRFAPKDAAAVERLVGIVERSALPSERQQAIVDRLRGDLGLGERVSRAVRDALGRDDAGERAALIGALERVTDPGATSAGDAARVVAEAVASSTGMGAGAVEGLCRALSDWIGGWWEEEEEEAPPGDYAAEESGI